MTQSQQQTHFCGTCKFQVISDNHTECGPMTEEEAKAGVYKAYAYFGKRLHESDLMTLACVRTMDAAVKAEFVRKYSDNHTTADHMRYLGNMSSMSCENLAAAFCASYYGAFRTSYLRWNFGSVDAEKVEELSVGVDMEQLFGRTWWLVPDWVDECCVKVTF